jgi:hypothetical protein
MEWYKSIVLRIPNLFKVDLYASILPLFYKGDCSALTQKTEGEKPMHQEASGFKVKDTKSDHCMGFGGFW